MEHSLSSLAREVILLAGNLLLPLILIAALRVMAGAGIRLALAASFRTCLSILKALYRPLKTGLRKAWSWLWSWLRAKIKEAKEGKNKVAQEAMNQELKSSGQVIVKKL